MDFHLIDTLLSWVGAHPAWAGGVGMLIAFFESLALVGLFLPGAVLMFGVGALVGADTLLLWPTLWAVWLASNGRPAPQILVVFLLGTLLMRSAGCAINDFADRNFDPHVERTRNRPLAAREIEPAKPEDKSGPAGKRPKTPKKRKFLGRE